jgi:hypothetical protein
MEIKKILFFENSFYFSTFEIYKTQNINIEGQESLINLQDGGAYLFDSQRFNINGLTNIYATTVTSGGFIDLSFSIQVNQNL